MFLYQQFPTYPYDDGGFEVGQINPHSFVRGTFPILGPHKSLEPVLERSPVFKNGQIVLEETPFSHRDPHRRGNFPLHPLDVDLDHDVISGGVVQKVEAVDEEVVPLLHPERVLVPLLDRVVAGPVAVEMHVVTVPVPLAGLAPRPGRPLDAAPAFPRQPVARFRLLGGTPAGGALPAVPGFPEPPGGTPLAPVPFRVVAAALARPRDVTNAVAVARARGLPHKVPSRNGAFPFCERPLQLAPDAGSYPGVSPRVAPPAPRVGLALPGVEEVPAAVVGAPGVSPVLGRVGVPLEALSVGVLANVRVGGETPPVVHAPHALGSRRALTARRPRRARLVRARPVSQRGNSRY